MKGEKIIQGNYHKKGNWYEEKINVGMKALEGVYSKVINLSSTFYQATGARFRKSGASKMPRMARCTSSLRLFGVASRTLRTKVRLASLPRHPLKMLTNCTDKPAMLVRDNIIYAPWHSTTECTATSEKRHADLIRMPLGRTAARGAGGFYRRYSPCRFSLHEPFDGLDRRTVQELRRVVFPNPEKQNKNGQPIYETANAYLSGNVREDHTGISLPMILKSI